MENSFVLKSHLRWIGERTVEKIQLIDEKTVGIEENVSSLQNQVDGISIPTKISDLINDLKYIKKVNGVSADLNGDVVLIPFDIGASVNKNFFINWYFPDPVNQRGETEYTGTGYSIDRWRTTGLVSLDNGFLIGDSIVQRVENADSLLGHTVTFSVIDENGNLYTGTNDFLQTATNTFFLNQGVFKFLYSSYHKGFQIVCPNQKIKAAKLECGSVQTLAHKDAAGNWVLSDPPPDKTLELAKCHRYYWKSNIIFSSKEKYDLKHLICNIQFPVKMRVKPTITIYSINGTAGELSNWASRGDSGIHVTVNSVMKTDEGFSSMTTTEDMSSDAVYAFRVVADAEL